MDQAKDQAGEAGQTLSELGAAKGGKARAASLTLEERKAIARHAAEKRWGRRQSGIPKETHSGLLKLAGQEIACAVLQDGTRVLSERGVIKALGGKRGGSHWLRKKADPIGANLPIYASASNLQPYIGAELMVALITPKVYQTEHGAKANGVPATLLPQICEVWLKARDAGALHPKQTHIAEAADVLMRGFAHVGIIALVDEATGYQADRARDELNRILEAYISKELLPWTKRFPDEFFRQIYRLNRWDYREGNHKRPQVIGKLINKLIYEKLPPGVLPELKRLNPPTEKGYRRHRHHQLLTEDIGNQHLNNQIVEVVTLMRVSDDRDAFKRLFDKAFPTPGKAQQLDMEFDGAEKN